MQLDKASGCFRKRRQSWQREHPFCTNHRQDWEVNDHRWLYYIKKMQIYVLWPLASWTFPLTSSDSSYQWACWILHWEKLFSWNNPNFITERINLENVKRLNVQCLFWFLFRNVKWKHFKYVKYVHWLPHTGKYSGGAQIVQIEFLVRFHKSMSFLESVWFTIWNW